MDPSEHSPYSSPTHLSRSVFHAQGTTSTSPHQVPYPATSSRKRGIEQHSMLRNVLSTVSHTRRLILPGRIVMMGRWCGFGMGVWGLSTGRKDSWSDNSSLRKRGGRLLRRKRRPPYMIVRTRANAKCSLGAAIGGKANKPFIPLDILLPYQSSQIRR